MPGVLLHEIIIWLTAGMLNVSTEGDLSLPKKQEIGELKLEFVKLPRRTPAYKVALINIAPFIIGVALIWFVATNLLEVQNAVSLLNANDNTSTLSNLGDTIRQLTSQTDFWLWVYLLFTIANTMIPESDTIGIWLRRGTYIVIGIGILFVLGINTVVNADIFGPFITGLNALSSVFAFTIALNVFGVALLSLIENTIEWITGDSATFKDGKMITMSRAEALAAKHQERQKKLKSRREQRRAPLTSGPPSIYKIEFPIPDSPGEEEPISQQATSIIEPTEDKLRVKPPSRQRDEPKIISGSVEQKTSPSNLENDNDDAIIAIDPQEKSTDSLALRDSLFGDANEDEDEGDVLYEDFEDPA